MATNLPPGGPSHDPTGQELYPGSPLRDDIDWPLSGIKPHSDNPQDQTQQLAPQHLGLPSSQPPGYGIYNPVDVNREHPLAQWSGTESLGPFPSQKEVVATIENRPRTPSSRTSSKRFFSLAKKSFESLRGRKNSLSEGDSEISGNTPPMPTGFPTHHDVMGIQRDYGSSSQILLNNSSFQLPDEQARY
jgi:hypothetical protein